MNVNWLANTVVKVVAELEKETQNITAAIIIKINSNISSIEEAEKRNVNTEYANLKTGYPDLQSEMTNIIPGLPLL